MPSFKIITQVDGNVQTVYSRFGPELLLQLTPPLLKVRIHEMAYPIRLDTPVKIEVRILGLIRQHWHNTITELSETEDACFFVDEGVELPSMLKTWRHKHLIRQGMNGNTEIVDDIHFRTSNQLMDLLLYPAIYLQFWYRKAVYRRFFRKP